MTIKTQKEIAYKWIMGVWDKGDFTLLESLASPEYVFRTPGQDNRGPKAFQDFVSQIRAGFPDYNIVIDSQHAEEGIVITKGISFGTHTTEFNGVAPTHKPIEVHWVMYTRIQNSKIVEDWEIYDALGILTQLGLT